MATPTATRFMTPMPMPPAAVIASHKSLVFSTLSPLCTHPRPRPVKAAKAHVATCSPHSSVIFNNISSPHRAAALICNAEKEYKFPDPIPEFADSETEKFKTHLLNNLSKKDMYGDSVDEVVGICTEILNEFLHTEYGGPGTLLVNPFIDMADTISERGLPGGPQAARAAVKWAQAHVDNDWKEWTN